jgi:cytochrome c-type biogenesis protein CcmH
MTSLWPWLILLSVVAMLFVAVPLWRYREVAARSALAQRREKNREVFQQREGELAQDLRQGLVTADEHAKLLAELQRAFMLDMQALVRQDGGKSAWSGGKPVLLVLMLLIPLVSLLFYRGWGSGPDLELPELLSRLGAAQSEAEQSAILGELADFLQNRFERRPEDIQNGYMLGTLYMQLERLPEAITTFEQMLARMEAGVDRATVLGQLAQAQYVLADSQITPAVQTAIDEALSLNPNEFAVMSILAIDAFLKEDFAGAIAYWRRQLSAATPGSQQAETLRQRITMVEAYLPAAETASTAAVDTGNTIRVVVDIAPEMAAQLDEFTSLFVYVRNPALPMPILAQNLPVPEFPFTITLDNSMSMTGMTVESAPSLVVGARLSRTGTATAQSGDLQTLSEPFVLAELTVPVNLLIDEIAP